MKTLKKFLVIALAAATMAVSALALSACKSKESVAADITAQWSFYSVTDETGTNFRIPGEPEEDLPFFVCNGTEFELCLVPGKVYHGTITENEDGTYTLTEDDPDKAIQAEIDGNMLVIHFSEVNEIAFEAVG